MQLVAVYLTTTSMCAKREKSLCHCLEWREAPQLGRTVFIHGFLTYRKGNFLDTNKAHVRRLERTIGDVRKKKAVG